MFKGVVLTHYHVVANILQVGHVERRYLSWEVDSQLGVPPFYHIYVSTVPLSSPPVFRCYHTNNPRDSQLSS